MTMLDRMRRHKSWLKWSLALVCLAFVIFYIPDFLQGGSGVQPGDRVASVGSRTITPADFRRRYQQQVDAYRAAYGGTLTEEQIRLLQVDQQVLQQMIEENAELAEAERLGLNVTDEEIRARILTIPALQENGRFIGEQRYRELLQMQQPPVSPAEFEETLRLQLLVEKLRTGLTAWMSVPDGELEREFRYRNERVKLEVVPVLAANVRQEVTATDAEIAARYETDKERYRAPDRRKIRFVLIDAAQVRAKLAVPREEVERYYNDNVSSFSTPEQVRASHILLRTEGKAEADVRKQAEEVLKQARAGADFAELARKYSEDDSNAQDGGDLDYSSRGRMVAEFEDAAFLLQPDQISDIVKTPYGLHIIKLTDRKAPIARTLGDPELYREIVDIVGLDLADRQVAELADAVVRDAPTPAELDKAAAAHGLTAEESDFFAQGEAVGRLGLQPEVNSRAFELADSVSSGPMAVPAGRVVFFVSGRQASHVPPLEEVRDQARDDVLQAKAVELARKRAEALASDLKRAADFPKAAKAAGFEAMTTDLLTRESVIPGVGLSPEIDTAAFALPVGGVSDPISTDEGAAIVRVVERPGLTADDFTARKDEFREDLLAERRSRFFTTYMDRAKARMQITIDPEALKRISG